VTGPFRDADEARRPAALDAILSLPEIGSRSVRAIAIAIAIAIRMAVVEPRIAAALFVHREFRARRQDDHSKSYMCAN